MWAEEEEEEDAAAVVGAASCQPPLEPTTRPTAECAPGGAASQPRLGARGVVLRGFGPARPCLRAVSRQMVLRGVVTVGGWARCLWVAERVRERQQ